MKNVDTILDEFLHEQSERLKERTFRDYQDVISLFQDYLNQYAYRFLNEHESEKWETQIDESVDFFTKTFGQDKLVTSVISDFLDYFIIRKVMSGEEFMKVSIRVMKKLAKWLYENNYVPQDTYDDFKEYFGDAKDLPNVEKLAELIFYHANKSPRKRYKEILEGYFSVTDIEQEQLWLDEDLGEKTNIGPVLVSKQISDLCQKGLRINLVIGKYQGSWYILETGNVYPY